MAAKCLPSGDAAIDFVRDPTLTNTGKVLGTFALRGLLVGTGIYLAGARGSSFWLYTTAATGMIELGVLTWAAWACRNEAPRKKNPLRHGSSQRTFQYNVRKLRREGYPRKKALAIAYRIQRSN